MLNTFCNNFKELNIIFCITGWVVKTKIAPQKSSIN